MIVGVLNGAKVVAAAMEQRRGRLLLPGLGISSQRRGVWGRGAEAQQDRTGGLLEVQRGVRSVVGPWGGGLGAWGSDCVPLLARSG